MAPKGDHSRFISQAALHYMQTQSAANLKERLKQGALANARLNLEIAEEWFPVEQEQFGNSIKGNSPERLPVARREEAGWTSFPPFVSIRSARWIGGDWSSTSLVRISARSR